MAYANIATTFGMAMNGVTSFARNTPDTAAAKSGFFARLSAAISASREAAARREIARHSWLIDQLNDSRAMSKSNGLPF
jgi:hypothetical protein